MSKEMVVPLKMDQLSFTATYVSISITQFKHIQAQSIPDIYPVSYLIQYLSLRGYESGHLFAFPTLSSIPRQLFSKQLSRLITQ